MNERRRPARSGGESEWIVTPADAGVRLDRYLADGLRLGSRGRAAWALERRKVLVNGVDTGLDDRGRRLSAGDTVRIWIDRPGTAREHARGAGARGGRLQIVFEDPFVAVVNKPPALRTVPLARRAQAESVESLLTVHMRSKAARRPLVVHRIDRDTSGLVVFATRPDAQHRLTEQFRRHEPRRVYLVVVHGVPSGAAGVWTDDLVWDQASLTQRAAHGRDPRSRKSSCEYRVLEHFGHAALLEIALHSGRRNQIRAQAQLHGHPLVGERQYVTPGERPRVTFHRQALHAHRLTFRHPSSGRTLTFEAPLPPDMDELMEQLRSDRG